MSISSLEWARDTERELRAEIRTLTALNGAGDRDAEALGMVRQSDHLDHLRERLAQVERLIDAIEDTASGDNPGWFPGIDADGKPQPEKAVR